MAFEDEYAGRGRKRSGINAFLPFLGLILIISFGAIAYILSEPVHQYIYTQFIEESEIRNATPVEDSFDNEKIQYVVGGAIFIILVMIGGALYALGAPKEKIKVTERELKQEKLRREEEVRAMKRRKQAINKAVAAERERKQRRDG